MQLQATYRTQLVTSFMLVVMAACSWGTGAAGGLQPFLYAAW